MQIKQNLSKKENRKFKYPKTDQCDLVAIEFKRIIDMINSKKRILIKNRRLHVVKTYEIF